ncbi:MAG: hypothetical protein C4523_12405 [Myxococcales bacterium]|nr:MAG: hypothetical protein C4523_12405 [Myxococcales bacterium]
MGGRRMGRSHNQGARFFALLLALLPVCSPAFAAAAPSNDSPIVSDVVIDLPVEITDPALKIQLDEIEAKLILKPGEPYSRERVQEAVRDLYQRDVFQQIQVFVKKEAGTVALRIAPTLKTKVKEIVFEGRSELGESDLRSAVRMRPGDTLLADDLTRETMRLEAFCRRNGFTEAMVTASTAPSDEADKVIVRFAIDEGEPLAISSIEFAGDPYFPPKWLKRKFVARVGDTMSLDALADAIRGLKKNYREQGFEEASIDLADADESKWRESPLFMEGKVRLDIRAGRRVKVAFIGNNRYSPSELRRVLRLDAEEMLTYDYATLGRLKKTLTDFYLRQGYLHIAIRVTEEILATRDKRVVFHIREGTRVKLRDVRFAGSEAFDNRELKKELLASVRDQLAADEDDSLKPIAPGGLRWAVSSEEDRARAHPSRPITPYERPEDLDSDAIYIPEIYAEAVHALALFYREHGFLDAEIEGPELSFNETGQRLVLNYVVREGAQTFVQTLRIAGVDDSRYGKVAKLVSIAPGQPLNDLIFEDIVKSIRKYYAAVGHIYAEADISYTLTPDREQAAVLVAVREGPEVRVGEILVAGLVTTKIDTVKEELTFEEGDVYSPNEMEQSQRWLGKLGIFQSVTLNPWNAEKEEEVKKVLINAIERKQGRFELSGGLATDDGLRSEMLFVYRNLFGLALEYHLNVKANHRIPALLDPQFAALYDDLPFYDSLERQVSTGFYYPSIRGSHIGLRTDLVHLRRQERAYGLDKNSTIVSFDTELFRRLTLVQANEFAYLDSKHTTLSALRDDEIVPPDGLRWEYSPKFQAVYDYRDSLFNPTKGFIVTGLLEYFETLAGDTDSDILRGSGSLAGYVPIPLMRRPIVLRLTGKSGAIANFSELETDVDKRFKLGGRTSLRGFGEDAVYPADLDQNQIVQIQRDDLPSPGGDAYVLFKLDLRVPVYKTYYAGAFLDSGNLWIQPSRMDLRLDRYKNAAGGGLHYRTPVGDLSVEIGWNLKPDKRLNEDSWRLHFSISLF